MRGRHRPGHTFSRVGTFRRDEMNDLALADLLAELDHELGRTTDAGSVACRVLDCVEARVPGSVLKSAATLQLRGLGCPAFPQVR